MKKLYLDLRTVSSVPNAYQATAAEMMSYSGANIGNFAFRHALTSLINLNEYMPVDYSEFNMAVAKQKPESVVISCANWLCATEQYEISNAVRAATIENEDCPIAVFGLGAQAKTDQNDFKLGPNTERLAKVIAERSTKVSVRDEFTLNTLEKIGITNAIITGCPSNFINLNKELGSSIVDKCQKVLDKQPSWQDLKIHFSEISGGHKSSGRVLHETLEILLESSSFYIIQSPVLFPFVLNEDDQIPGDYLANKPDSIKTTKGVRRFLKSKLMHFGSIEAWMDFARTCDLSIGMRIHGNMVPLQAGVPSVVIGHDSRTNGLSKMMGIPVISPEGFVESVENSPSKLIEYIQSEMLDYDRKRAVLGQTFSTYIKGNSLETSDSLTSFLGT